MWLGLAISAVFLYLAFRKSDWSLIWSRVQETDLLYIVASLPLLAVIFLLRAVRWRHLLLPAGRPAFSSLVSAIMIGFMSLNLLPFRLGEFIRAYVLGRRASMSKTGVFATVMVERVLDGFTTLFLLLLVLFLRPLPESSRVGVWIQAFSYLALFIFVSAMVFLVLARLRTDWIVRVLERILGRFPGLLGPVVRIVRAFAGGLDVLSDFRLFATSIGLSVLIWLTMAAWYWTLMFAFGAVGGSGMGGQVGFLGSVFVLVAIALGVMIPSSPGFVGPYEFACIMALTALGVDTAGAESYALVSHAAQFIPITLIGLVYLYIENFSLREVRSEGVRLKSEFEPPE